MAAVEMVYVHFKMGSTVVNVQLDGRDVIAVLDLKWNAVIRLIMTMVSFIDSLLYLSFYLTTQLALYFYNNSIGMFYFGNNCWLTLL